MALAGYLAAACLCQCWEMEGDVLVLLFECERYFEGTVVTSWFVALWTLRRANIGGCCGLLSFCILHSSFSFVPCMTFRTNYRRYPPSDGRHTSFEDKGVSLTINLLISATRSSFQNPPVAERAVVADFCVDIVVCLGAVAGQHAHDGGDPCEGLGRSGRAGRALGRAAGGGG